MEQELGLLLRDKAEDIFVDAARRDRTLRSARRARSVVALVGAAAVVVVAVGGFVMIDSLRTSPGPLPPAETPQEERSDEDEPFTDVLIAEAQDGSWKLMAGLSEDRETLCFSLQGGGAGCGSVPLDGFILFGSFDYLDEEGFIYGPVHSEVATLQLEIRRGLPIDLRMFDAPEELRLPDMRFFVRRVRGEGEGGGTLVARDVHGGVLQRTETRWGKFRSGSESEQR
jgi:hypothetical protein